MTAAAAAGKAAINQLFNSSRKSLYFKLDNVVYQVGNATVNQATVDAGIEEIATTTWAGFGTDLKELTGTTRDKAISVFGEYNNGTTITANSNATATLSAKAQAYHPYGSMNVAGSVTTNSFIKNRLSSIELHQ